MPVFNRANVVEAAIRGILQERRDNYPNLELVIMDGGSKDGTCERVRAFGDQIDVFVSEKDSGASEAFTKGIKRSRGEIVRYIAADDTLIPDGTRRMVEHLVAHPEFSVAGALSVDYHVSPDGSRRRAGTPRVGGELTFADLVTWCDGTKFSAIETWHFRREVFDRVGFLDPRYRICPDLDFAFRVIKAGLRFDVLPVAIIEKCFYADGSNLVANVPKLVRERREVVRRHAGLTAGGLAFLYHYPTPLHQRVARWPWDTASRLWLAGVKAWQRSSPGSYGQVKRLLGR